MSHYPVRPQLQQNAWVCTFCGVKYPSEQERDLHMAGNCKDSPVPLMEEMPPQQSRQRPPMMKANTFSHPEEIQHQYRQDQAQGYAYHNAPNTPPQPLFQSQMQPPSRPNYIQRPGIPGPSQTQYPPTQQWDQPSSLRGYAPPLPVHQEAGHSGHGGNRGRSLPEEPQEGARHMRGPRPFHSTVPVQPSSGFGDGAASQQINRRVSDSQERQPHFGYNMPPNEPDISPLAKVNSPITPSGEKAKVTIIWKKEIPTLEKEITYIDNIQDPVALAWSDERELFQGNTTFSQGNHTGSLFFPTGGEMQAVLPFEVRKKGMAMAMVVLKLAEVKSPIKSEPSKLPMPSSTPKLTKNGSEEAKSVPPTEKEKKGMREQLLKQNQELKDKEEKIKRMREEMDCLNKSIDTVKEDKQKVKKESVKLDEQLIQVMTEMSSIRTYGSIEEQKLEKENKSLKNELELLRHKEPIDGDELLAAKEQIDQLKSHINSLEDTKLQDDRLNEKIQTLQTELKILQAKEEELEKLKTEQQELVNTNKDLQAEVNKSKYELNVSIRDREELEKKANKMQAEILEKEARMQKESGKYEEEKHSQTQEQEELIKNLKTSLEERDKKFSEKEKEIIVLVKSKMSVESDLKQARNELREMMENSENIEATEQMEQLTKENSELKEDIHKLREKNKKYKNDHSQISNELKTVKEEIIENRKNSEQTISEAENKAIKEIKELEESNQKQETELKTLKDQIQDISKQKQELRKRNEQQILQYKDEVVSRDKQISELRKQIEENKDKEESENKIKALNDELEQQKSDYEDLRGEIKRLEKEIEGKKNYFEEITVESTKDKDKMQDQYSKIEKEKQDLQKQVDGLHTLVNGLKVSTGNLKFKLDYSDKEKEKTKTENDKLKKELAEMADQEKMKKDIETNKIEELEKELKSERESSAILKQLIGKLNEDVKNHTGDETVKLKEELEQAEKYKNSLEYKLEQMSKEIANRDSEIQQLSRKNRDVLAEDRVRNIEIPRSDSKSKSEKNLFPIKIDEKEKSKVAASKISADKPLGAEGGSPISTIKPILNPTTKSPLKFKYRGTNVNALKLKALPSQKPHLNKQVLCLIKKNLELGTLMAVVEVPTKVGFSTKVAKYVGVLLNEAVGDSDGTFHGSQVFQCERNHGWFAPLEDVYVPVI